MVKWRGFDLKLSFNFNFLEDVGTCGVFLAIVFFPFWAPFYFIHACLIKFDIQPASREVLINVAIAIASIILHRHSVSVVAALSLSVEGLGRIMESCHTLAGLYSGTSHLIRFGKFFQKDGTLEPKALSIFTALTAVMRSEREYFRTFKHQNGITWRYWARCVLDMLVVLITVTLSPVIIVLVLVMLISSGGHSAFVTLSSAIVFDFIEFPVSQIAALCLIAFAFFVQFAALFTSRLLSRDNAVLIVQRAVANDIWAMNEREADEDTVSTLVGSLCFTERGHRQLERNCNAGNCSIPYCAKQKILQWQALVYFKDQHSGAWMKCSSTGNFEKVVDEGEVERFSEGRSTSGQFVHVDAETHTVFDKEQSFFRRVMKSISFRNVQPIVKRTNDDVGLTRSSTIT